MHHLQIGRFFLGWRIRAIIEYWFAGSGLSIDIRDPEGLTGQPIGGGQSYYNERVLHPKNLV
jgi:hypothetical protein